MLLGHPAPSAPRSTPGETTSAWAKQWSSAEAARRRVEPGTAARRRAGAARASLWSEAACSHPSTHCCMPRASTYRGPRDKRPRIAPASSERPLEHPSVTSSRLSARLALSPCGNRLSQRFVALSRASANGCTAASFQSFYHCRHRRSAGSFFDAPVAKDPYGRARPRSADCQVPAERARKRSAATCPTCALPCPADARPAATRRRRLADMSRRKRLPLVSLTTIKFLRSPLMTPPCVQWMKCRRRIGVACYSIWTLAKPI